MIPSMVGEILLRQVPEHLLSGVQSGELRVYGSIIRSLTSGQIVGHLQETSGLAQAASAVWGTSAGLPLPGVGLAVQAVGQGVSIVQNEQIKAAINVVQNLQMANIALGAVGIGVSVVGFAIVVKKIAGMETKIDRMGERLDQIGRTVEALRQNRIAEDFNRLRTAAEQMEEGWLLADPLYQWRQVALEAHAVANTFESRVNELLESRSDLDTLDPFLDAFALASATRVSARMAAGEDLAARRAAEDGAQTLASFGRHLRLSDAALKRVEREGVAPATKAWGESLTASANVLRDSFAAARRRETAAAATVLTILELEKQGISGRSWLDAARAEDTSPLICLLPAPA